MKINRKKILIFVLLGFVIFLVAGYFLILDKQEQEDSIETTKNLFPFGDINPGKGSLFGGEQGTIGEGQDGQETKDTTSPEPTLELAPRLRQISFFPTGGFKSFTQTEDKEVSEVSFDEEGNSSQIIKTIEVVNQLVRYTDIENADIYESKVTSSEIVSDIIVSNFIPNAEFSYFNPLADTILFQYWNSSDQVTESYLAQIKKLELDILECPFDFKPLQLEEDDVRIIGLHEFLNRNQQTRLALSGTNSPGNEGSLVTPSTITAIKNFQSLYQLNIDGELGLGTQKKMQEVCDLQEREFAQERFDEKEYKYDISGFFLPQNITAATMSPFQNLLFYIKENEGGVVGVVRDLETDTKETVFESPFTEWLTHWNGEESITLNTKPSYAALGYIYELNPTTGRYFKSFGGLKGLLARSNKSATRFISSENSNTSLQSSIYNTDTRRSIPISNQTFPEKCVWANDDITLYCAVPNALAFGEEYPDSWYQGLENYNDSLWVINSLTLEEELLSNISIEYGELIDVEQVSISASDEYLYFLDKSTEFLWSYRLVDY